jgi:hypothetical protein
VIQICEEGFHVSHSLETWVQNLSQPQFQLRLAVFKDTDQLSHLDFGSVLSFGFLTVTTDIALLVKPWCRETFLTVDLFLKKIVAVASLSYALTAELLFVHCMRVSLAPYFSFNAFNGKAYS